MVPTTSTPNAPPRPRISSPEKRLRAPSHRPDDHHQRDQRGAPPNAPSTLPTEPGESATDGVNTRRPRQPRAIRHRSNGYALHATAPRAPISGVGAEVHRSCTPRRRWADGGDDHTPTTERGAPDPMAACQAVRVHVVLVVPGGVDRSGTDRVIPALLWLIEGMARRHRVTVVALGQEPTACRYPLLGATVVNVPPERPGPHRLARMVTRGVHAAGAEGRPDIVHGFWASVSGLIAVTAARRHRAPSVVHVAGGELVALPELSYGGARGRGGRWIAAAALRGADAVTVSSQWMAGAVRARGHAVTDVIPLGVDITIFRPPDAPGPVRPPATTTAPTDRGSPHLVQVANLNPVKDQPTLLHAVALAREAGRSLRVDVIGVDTMGGRIQALARHLGLDDVVTFTGVLRSDDVAARLRSATLHVLTSRHDAAPVAVLEAAACGVPTVGTDVGYVADLARLRPPAAAAVPVGDPAALARAIGDLLEDGGRRHALAAAAQSWALANDAASTVARFGALYDRLTSSRRNSDTASSGSVPRAST
jgi:glycosyltransferase involved in cell wall biosynthesis